MAGQDSVRGTQQISALLRDSSLLDETQFPGAGSLTSQEDLFSKDDSISVVTSQYSLDTLDMYENQSESKDPKSKFKKQKTSNLEVSGTNIGNDTRNHKSSKKDSIISDESFATTVYTEETVELRDGQKIRQMTKKNKKKKHFKTDSRGSLFQKKSIHSHNILPANTLSAKNIDNPNTSQQQQSNNSQNSSKSKENGSMTKSGLTKQLKNYYGSPANGAIRESFDMDSNEHDDQNTGARGSYSHGSAPLDRESLIVKKSVLTLRQRTQFPQKQIRVKLYLPHSPEDENPQQIILFINPGATMGFVKQFLEDSYPHKILQGRITQLCIADEDGDIDDDFPPIDPNQDITRLGVMNFFIDVTFPTDRFKNKSKNADALKSIDSSKEIDRFSNNTIDNAPDLPMTMESFDNNNGSNFNTNNTNNDFNNNSNNYYPSNDELNRYNQQGAHSNFVVTERRLSGASRQLNEHRKSLSLEKDKNYFEKQPQKQGLFSCFCCSSPASGDDNSNKNRNKKKSNKRRYSYRKEVSQTYKDANNNEKERLLGTYQSPVLPGTSKMINENVSFENKYNHMYNNGVTDVEMGTGARGTYNATKPGRGASVMSSDTQASNRQFDKV